jgi:hypothetical protein
MRRKRQNTDEGAVNPLPVTNGRDFTSARNCLASAWVCPVVPPKFGFDLFLDILDPAGENFCRST